MTAPASEKTGSRPAATAGLAPRPTEIFSSTSDILRPGHVLRTMVAELPTAWSVGWALAQRKLRATYRDSKLGYLWLLIAPLLYSVIFVVVREGMRSHGLEIQTNHVPAGLFAFVGIAMFQVWMDGILSQLEAIRGNRDIIASMSLPPETFFLSAFFVNFVGLTIRLLLIAIAIAGFGIVPAKTVWLMPVLGLVIAISGNAIGIVLAPLATIYRDIRTAIQSISLGLLLVSPVFYPATTKTDSALYIINMCNPLAGPITILRDVTFGGGFDYLAPTMIWTAALLALALAVAFIMRIVRPLLVERLA